MNFNKYALCILTLLLEPDFTLRKFMNIYVYANI